MSWVAVGLGGLGLVQGMGQAKAQKKANERNAKISAAQMEFSPWTGMSPQGFQSQAVDVAGSALGGAAKGALSGMIHNQANAKPGMDAPVGEKAYTGFQQQTPMTDQMIGQSGAFNPMQNPWEMQSFQRPPSLYAGK